MVPILPQGLQLACYNQAGKLSPKEINMVPYTDTHCHLDFSRFQNDREQVIERAKQAGLVWILNPGIDPETNQAAIDLSGKYSDFISAAVGIHPNYGKPWSQELLNRLKAQAHSKGVVGIGEIGLDYYRQHTPKPQQQRMFKEQLALAAECSLPVIIHNRNSTQDLMQILSEWHAGLERTGHPLAKRPGVLHSYSSDLDTARAAIKMNFYIGISGPVTFKNAPDRKSVTRSLPLERLLLETDAPFLTPYPHRGQRNEPAYIPLIAEEISRLHNTSPKQVAEITYSNAQILFNITQLPDHRGSP
jgi:TatD DNase family protein